MTADGWFVTGDAAVIGPDGFHRIVGRTSIDIIKSGGFKVGAGEVEAALLSHPAVAEVAVVGLADPDLGERIVAFVVGDVPDPIAADRPCGRPAVGAQAAARDPRGRRRCRATRWARCRSSSCEPDRAAPAAVGQIATTSIARW